MSNPTRFFTVTDRNGDIVDAGRITGYSWETPRFDNLEPGDTVEIYDRQRWTADERAEQANTAKAERIQALRAELEQLDPPAEEQQGLRAV